MSSEDAHGASWEIFCIRFSPSRKPVRVRLIGTVSINRNTLSTCCNKKITANRKGVGVPEWLGALFLAPMVWVQFPPRRPFH